MMTRNSKKTDSLYETLRLKILSGQYPSGCRLPVENVFCKELGVARITLRRTLSMLESENLVERIPRIGTFVRGKRPYITFQLPCPDFLTHPDDTSYLSRAMMSGLMRIVLERNIHTETWVASSTNDPENIQIKAIKNFNDCSRIMINSLWSRQVFPALAATGAKVCVADPQNYLQEKYVQCTRDWQWLLLDRKAGTAKTVELLAKAGKKRIALAMVYILRVEHHPVLDAYLQAMKHAGLTPIYKGHDLHDDHSLRNFYNETHFDAIITEPPHDNTSDFRGTVHEFLSIPENISVVMTSECFEQKFTAPVPYFSFDYVSIGRRAAKMLLDEPRGITETVQPVYNHFEMIMK